MGSSTFLIGFVRRTVRIECEQVYGMLASYHIISINMRSIIPAVLLIACYVIAAPAGQVPLSAHLSALSQHPSSNDHPGCLPKINYLSDEDVFSHIDPPEDMSLTPLHVSGDWEDRVDLTFFADGCKLYLSISGQKTDKVDTQHEEHKFLKDAKKLTEDIISPGGAMADVAHLLNVYAVFVPSEQVCLHPISRICLVDRRLIMLVWYRKP